MCVTRGGERIGFGRSSYDQGLPQQLEVTCEHCAVGGAPDDLDAIRPVNLR